jgi:hypothetical protein
MRGSAPTAQCLAQWGTPEPTEKATEAPATQAPAETTVEEVKPVPPVMEESFAAALAFAALALHA